MPRSNDFRHYVYWQRNVPSEVEPMGGHDIPHWVNMPASDSPKIAAEIKPLTGREAEQVRQTLATADTSIRMRYHNIKPEDRILWGEVKFDVTSVTHTIERKRETILLCTRVE